MGVIAWVDIEAIIVIYNNVCINNIKHNRYYVYVYIMISVSISLATGYVNIWVIVFLMGNSQLFTIYRPDSVKSQLVILIAVTCTVIW